MHFPFGCPVCCQRLSPELSCICGFQGEFSDGKYHLHCVDDGWEKCLAQVQAERKYCEANSATPNPSANARAQYMNELMISRCIALLGEVVREATFVDLGGASGWAVHLYNAAGARRGAVLEIDADRLPVSAPGLTAVVGDGYRMPFATGSADFIFDCSTLHHFEDLPRVLKEIHRVLRPQGVYVSQGNSPRRKDQSSHRQYYMDTFGLIETHPTREEYAAAFRASFGKSCEWHPVEDNMVTYIRKELGV